MNSKKLRSSFLKWAIALAIVPFLFSCTQPEGYGGSSTIKGVLMTKYYNDDFSVLIKEEPAVDEEIFILFGEDDFVGDRVVTSATGAFEFPFLNAGDYRLYYMSEDSSTVSNEQTTVIIDLNLSQGKSENQGTIYRLETLDFDDGSSKISGIVKVINYKNDTFYPFLEVKDITLAQEQEVYLVYGDHEFYDERIRTNFDGYFEFPDLIPGTYKVFVYSEDVAGGTEDLPISRDVTITAAGEDHVVAEITIEQL